MFSSMYITHSWHITQSYVHNFIYICYVHIIDFMIHYYRKAEKVTVFFKRPLPIIMKGGELWLYLNNEKNTYMIIKSQS